MKTYLTLTMLMLSITSKQFAQTGTVPKWQLSAGTSYAIPITNFDLGVNQRNVGLNLGIQRNLNQKSALTLTYNKQNYYSFFNGNKFTTNQQNLNLGYMYFLDKKRTWFVSGDIGIQSINNFNSLSIAYGAQIGKQFKLKNGHNLQVAYRVGYAPKLGGYNFSNMITIAYQINLGKRKVKN